MREPIRPWPVLMLTAGLVAAAGMPALAQTADDLELRRVMLSTGGVGYFEYETVVAGNADLTLEVRLDQVDDVMKSIVVYDDQGGIGEISLPGLEPLREVFRELPFGPEALSSPVALLNALRGAEVRATGAREVVGRLLSVNEEVVQLPNNGGTIVQHRVSLMTALGVQQLILEETSSLEFTDPELREQVEDALAALSQHNERDRRQIAISMTGEGERTVRVAYVVEAPLWKSTYRLTVSDDPDATEGDVQGWAVLENMSGEDWDDVELSIVSGNPVTFRQALYASYYVSRPEVPVEVLGRVLPRVDEGAIERERDDFVGGEVGLAMPMPAAPADARSAAPFGAFDMAPAAEAVAPPPPAQAQLIAAQSTEATTQVVFRLPNPISVDSGESLLVPIISRTIPVERLSLFQPTTHPINPLATVRMINDSETGLPPGVLTLYERAAGSGIVSFVGDARLAALPAGEERLISFAVDQRVRIDSETSGTQTIAQGRIADGVLRLTLTDRQETVYTIAGAAREPRTIMLEHPRLAGWDLLPPDDAEIEQTETAWRISVDVPADTTRDVAVVTQRPVYDVVNLSSMTTSQIAFYSSAPQLSPEVRQAVQRLSSFMADITNAQQALNVLLDEQRTIVSDQGRVRANLESVPRDSDLYRRYIATLTQQEDRLDALTGEITAAQRKLELARQALAQYVRSLTI